MFAGSKALGPSLEMKGKLVLYDTSSALPKSCLARLWEKQLVLSEHPRVPILCNLERRDLSMTRD